MLTLEMIKRLNEEDRGFWLNKCKVEELNEIIKNWRTKEIRKELGYSYKFKKAERIEFISKMIEYDIKKDIEDKLEEVKNSASEEMREELTKGDFIEDLDLKCFYYELIKNRHEKDRNLKEMNDPWRYLLDKDEQKAREYYGGLMRYFHSDTSEHDDKEMLNIIKEGYRYNKDEHEYYGELAKNYKEEDDVDFSDLDINLDATKEAVDYMELEDGEDDELNFEIE